MEPTYKLSELLKKKRPVPRKLNIYKEVDTKGVNLNQSQNPPDSNAYTIKLSATRTPERSRPNPVLNFSHIPEIRPLGKENRSSSVSRKEERAASVKRNMRDRQHNYSWLNEKSIATDIQEIEHKRTDLANKFQIYLSSDRKNAHKRNLSSKRVINGVPSKPYRRLNSSCAETRQRVPSQERKIGHIHKNSSLLNNSLMLDEPGNISRDQSYLKELLDEDTSYASEANGAGMSLSPHKIEESYIDHSNGMILNNSRQTISRNYYHEEDKKKSPLYDKGKQLFREKKYEEGITYLQDSLKQEEKTIEALYLLGVSYLWLGQYENSIREFKAFLELQPACHKNIYVLLSIAYKKINDLPSAIKTLTKAIQKYPKYYDAYIFRGKLYLKEKMWDRALSDFTISTKLQPSKNLALIGQGDAFRMLGDRDRAIDSYTQAIERGPSSLGTALLKRGMVLIEAKKHDEALKDFDRAISLDPTHSEAYYFKGFVLEKKKDYSEAILSFEQAIKHKSSRKAVLKSLHEIAKIKIEQRNFYEAYHTLHRAELLELEEKAFSKLKLFTEGVINLMKRKFDEGVANLTEVIKKQDITDPFRPMAYNYRAYGYFCSNKIKEALEDYQNLQKISKLDQGSTYNKLLCEGILEAQSDNIDQALKKFAQASKIFPNKMEPYLYRGVLNLYSYYKAHPKIDANDLSTALEPVIEDLEKCLELNDNCSNLYYIQALVFYILGRFGVALQSMEKAIEKADENYAKYYHLRGIIFACSHNYYNAISDLSIALDLSKEMQSSYLERAKCYFTMGDLRQAFMDIQDYITVKSDDSNIHLWAGNLLFCTGAYEDAVKAYSNSDNIVNSEKLLALRVKCNIILKELNLALNDLDRLLELKTENNVYYYIDRECLLALKSTTANGGDSLEKESLEKGLQKLEKIISYKISGNIFALYDLFFYKSVFHFYLGDYEAAIDDLDRAMQIKEELEKLEKELGKGTTDQETKEMIKLLEETGSNSGSDEIKEDNMKNGTFDFKEYLYNKAVYSLMARKYEESLDLLLSVRSLVVPEEALELDILIKLINDQQNKSSPASTQATGEEHELVVFQHTNRLCSIFPAAVLPLSTQRVYTIRLSFCLPQVEPPSLTPEIDYTALAEIKVNSVENKPEAPWIKRTFGGVVFTENYTEKEEKEIENLKEVIKLNGLKEEEIYKSLANSQRTPTQDSNNILNQGIIIENEGRNNIDNAMFITEELFANGGRGKMKRSKTGGV